MQPREICCDSCPYSPTCEEENDFLRDAGLGEELAEASSEWLFTLANGPGYAPH